MERVPEENSLLSPTLSYRGGEGEEIYSGMGVLFALFAELPQMTITDQFSAWLIPEPQPQ